MNLYPVDSEALHECVARMVLLCSLFHYFLVDLQYDPHAGMGIFSEAFQDKGRHAPKVWAISTSIRNLSQFTSCA